MAAKPTVKIVSDLRPDLGYIIIDREDYDPKKHLLWEDEKQASQQVDRTAKRKPPDPQPSDEPAATAPQPVAANKRKQSETPAEEG